MAALLFHSSQRRSIFDTPKEVKTPHLLSLLLVTFSALIALVMYSQLPPIVPLFYSLSEHSQQLVAREWLLFVPAFSFFTFVVNIGLLRVLKTVDITFVQITAWMTTGLLGLLALSLLRIWIIL